MLLVFAFRSVAERVFPHGDIVCSLIELGVLIVTSELSEHAF